MAGGAATAFTAAAGDESASEGQEENQ